MADRSLLQYQKGEIVKPYECLTFTDSFMFGKVMENKEIGRAVLECFLQRQIGELQDIQVERGIQYTVDGKPVRLDVYTKDENSVYDMEMQNQNRQSIGKLELPKRSRFYHSAIDNDSLSKGISYSHLPENIVIFICTFDPFGMNMPVYSFERRCREWDELGLKDGTITYFFNTTYDIENGAIILPEDMKSMFSYIQTGMVTDPLTDRISVAVENTRRNASWRSDYMRELSLFMELREEGREEGKALLIEKMRQNGLSAEKIAEICGISIAEVQSLLKTEV